MNAVTTIHGPRPILLASQSNADLFARLRECDRMEAVLCREADALPMGPGLSAKFAETSVWREEQTRIETELRSRFHTFSGGVSLADFWERLA